MGRKTREGGLHIPQYPGVPGYSGQGERESFLVFFMDPSWGPSWGPTHCKPLRFIFGRISSSAASFKKHIIWGGGRRSCGLVEGLGCWPGSWAFLGQRVLALSSFCFSLS